MADPKPMTPERIAELRAQIASGTDVSPWDARMMLDEIERLRKALAQVAIHVARAVLYM